MGSLYRSQHELVYVFKVGTAPHIFEEALLEVGVAQLPHVVVDRLAQRRDLPAFKVAAHPRAEGTGPGFRGVLDRR